MKLHTATLLCLCATACSATRAPTPSAPTATAAAAPTAMVPTAPSVPSVAGRTFDGPPPATPCRAEVEGACETGSVSFEADGRASMVAPGSDIIEVGRYTQSGAQVEVSGRRSADVRFTLEDEGRSLVDASTHTRYRLRGVPTPEPAAR